MNLLEQSAKVRNKKKTRLIRFIISTASGIISVRLNKARYFMFVYRRDHNSVSVYERSFFMYELFRLYILFLITDRPSPFPVLLEVLVREAYQPQLIDHKTRTYN